MCARSRPKIPQESEHLPISSAIADPFRGLAQVIEGIDRRADRVKRECPFPGIRWLDFRAAGKPAKPSADRFGSIERTAPDGAAPFGRGGRAG